MSAHRDPGLDDSRDGTGELQIIAPRFGERPQVADYWLRVWAARGLLWAWHDSALSYIITALEDEAWRVREMALKVVARHQLQDALTIVGTMRDDPDSRVASAATRALVRLTENPEGRKRTK
jgi:HEAT repeat protein